MGKFLLKSNLVPQIRIFAPTPEINSIALLSFNRLFNRVPTTAQFNRNIENSVEKSVEIGIRGKWCRYGHKAANIPEDECGDWDCRFALQKKTANFPLFPERGKVSAKLSIGRPSSASLQ